MTHAQFTADYLDAIKRAVTVSRLVSQSVELKKRGKEFVGLCPFHVERTASFTVNDDKQFYHCFGCGAHGDVIDFVREHHGQSFVDAVRMLASEAGIGPPARLDPHAAAQAHRDAEERRRRETKQREAEQRAKADKVADATRKQLETCEGKQHAYLDRKGFPDIFVPVLPDGRMLIPIQNTRNETRSAQYIDSEGEKLFRSKPRSRATFTVSADIAKCGFARA